MRAYPRLLIVTGHYGCGKTNLAVNLARDFAAAGEGVLLFDLDIVNPYFRTADFAAPLADVGVEVVSPPFANTNLDIPALTGRLDAALDSRDPRRIILDVGGDDAGAMALGRYAAKLAARERRFLYVVNRFRYLTRTPAEAVALLREIESASRMRADAVVNNSNLGTETTAADVAEGCAFAKETARLAGLPLDMTAVRRGLAADVPDRYDVDVFVKTIWQE